MQVESPLSHLCHVLESVQKAAQTHKATLTSSEAVTRAVLIDPILRALGWNIANPDVVEVERTVKFGQIDYALLNQDGETKVVIEAKKLNQATKEQTLLQLVQYTMSLRHPPPVVITDGIIWKYYADLGPGKTAATEEIDIAKESLVMCAAMFVRLLDAAQFWYAPEDDLQQRIEQMQVDMDNLSQCLQSALKEINALKVPVTTTIPPTTPKVAVAPAPAISPPLPVQTGKGAPLNALGNPTHKKPTSIQFPNGQTFPLKSWAGLLAHCVEYAFTKSGAIPLPLPDVAGKKRELLNLVKPLPTNIETVYNSQKVYISTNYSAYGCIDNAIYILEKVGIDPALVKVEMSV